MYPQTSTTILQDVADAHHARWAVFRSRYEPMMRAFLATHFPTIEADDIIQETFVALVTVLPNYRYNPQEGGHFHNYLTGILRNKALKALEARRREERLREKVAAELPTVPASSEDEAEYRQWRESVYEIALQQLLADETIHERTKQIFVRLAVNGENPQTVAEALNVSYAAVVKTKERMLARLRQSVEAMKNV